MGGWGRILVSVAVVAGTAAVSAPSACANDYGWKDGRWRLELAGTTAFYSGHRSRTGDFGIVGSAEYEIPVVKHLTVGIKTYPFYYFDQDDAGEDTVFGVGVGPALRVYSKGAEHRGFFVEVSGVTLVTVGRFDGNSGSVNFLGEGGVGYKFKRDWHVAAKISHISNAGLAGSNAGVNTLGIAFGYTF